MVTSSTSLIFLSTSVLRTSKAIIDTSSGQEAFSQILINSTANEGSIS
jgi:hypothetical protein